MHSALIVSLLAAAAYAAEIETVHAAESEQKSEELHAAAHAAETEQKSEQKSEQGYTISAQALQAKVKAEAAKVEKARLESQVSMQDQMHQANSMTSAQRLEEMAALIDKEEHNASGEEMIKALSSEAKEALATLQHKFVVHNLEALEKIGQVNIPMGVKALDPAHDKAAKEGLSLVQEITAPFKAHMMEVDTKFPMLKPWTGKVQQFASFFEQETLNELFESPVKDLVKYKRVHETFTKEHQAQVEDFLEMSDMDDLLTVLRSPEL